MSGPDPAVAAVRTAVRRALADLEPGSRVLVACSGGADSLALAAGTGFVAARTGVAAGAVVVDHGWHDRSAEVSRRAAETCAALGLDPVEVVEVSSVGGGPDGGGPEGASGGRVSGDGGPEAAAREARYAALDAAAGRFGAVAVLLGHTLDDQAETVLLGLARGSGARSLAGMPARRGIYRRPLLELRRADTARACAALGLTPWQDPANADPGYARARVRAAMSTLEEALGPGLPAALARTAGQLAEDADALDAAASGLLESAAVTGSPAELQISQEISLKASVLAAAPPAIRRRALLAAARACGSPAGALSSRHALAMDALVTAWRGQGPVHLPGGVAARRTGSTLVLLAP